MDNGNIKLEFADIDDDTLLETESLGNDIIQFLANKNIKLTTASMALDYAKNNIHNYAILQNNCSSKRVNP